MNDKNPADKNGNTPLHLACENGNLDICRLLLNSVKEASGAAANPANFDGVTPLQIADQSGDVELTELLTSAVV